MSDNLLHPDDPRLTAYALGELSPTEQAEVERLLADAPDCRAAVEEIRSLAGQLTAGLQAEPVAGLSETQRAAIVATVGPAQATGAVASSQGIRWSRHLAAFGTLAAMGAMAVLMLPPRQPTGVSVSSRGTYFSRDVALREEELERLRTDHDFNTLTDLAIRFDDRSVKDVDYSISVPGEKSADDESISTGVRPGGSGVTKEPLSRALDRREKLAESRSGDASGPAVAAPQSQSSARERSKSLSIVTTAPAPFGQAVKEPASNARPTVTSRTEYDTYADSKHAATQAGRGGNQSGRRVLGYDAPQQQGGEALGVENKPRPTREAIAKNEAEVRLQKNRRAAPEAAGLSPTPGLQADVAAIKPNVALEAAPESGFVVLRGNDKEVAEVKKIIHDVEKGNWFVSTATSGGGGDATKNAAVEEKVAQYNKLISEKRFNEAVVVAKKAKQLAPENPVTDTMQLKAQLAKRDNYYRQSGETGQSRGWLYQLDELEAAATHSTPTIAYPEEERLRQLVERRKELADRESLAETIDSFGLPFRSTTAPGTEQYEPIHENAYVSPREQPLSTFSVDVDTASYANMRRFLNQGQWPPPDAVRIEEFVNYFSYDYPQPNSDRPFSVNVETGACPWQPEHRLVRIGLKGKEIARDKRPAGNLVFLVDVSGSMADQKKLPLVKEGLNLLAEQMTESDRIAIVTYSNTAAVKLDSTVGSDQQTIRSVINGLHANGSTNGAAGIQMAYDMAVRHFIDDGTNRVILCTDGDFNVGVTGDDELVKLIQERARTKVYFSVFGFGMGNLQDGKLEKLADKGNGHYAYIDDQNELRKVFVEELSGTLITIAKDVKVQVEFNPSIVGAYRQIGYENRALAAQDFADDKKDAGEIGAGHSVTALYEIVPTERVVAVAPRGESLRYQAVLVPKDGEAAAELLTVRLRYKQPDAATPRDVALLPLAVLDPVDTAKKLSELFDSDGEDAPKFEADVQQKRLAVRGKPEQLELARQALRSLGESPDASILYEMHVKDTPPASSRPSPDFNWAAAVAGFGMVLRGSHYRGQAGLDMILELAQGAKGEDKNGRRREFISLVERAKALRPEMASAVHRSAGTTQVDPPATASTPLSREEAQQKATVNGKYRNLLRVIEAPDDVKSYGAFRDWGHYTGTTYLEHKNLPQGYWVYVAPHWYIWGDKQ
jgi:Ca-activated chloride channel homolog